MVIDSLVLFYYDYFFRNVRLRVNLICREYVIKANKDSFVVTALLTKIIVLHDVEEVVDSIPTLFACLDEMS